MEIELISKEELDNILQDRIRRGRKPSELSKQILALDVNQVIKLSFEDKKTTKCCQSKVLCSFRTSRNLKETIMKEGYRIRTSMQGTVLYIWKEREVSM